MSIDWNEIGFIQKYIIHLKYTRSLTSVKSIEGHLFMVIKYPIALEFLFISFFFFVVVAMLILKKFATKNERISYIKKKTGQNATDIIHSIASVLFRTNSQIYCNKEIITILNLILPCRKPERERDGFKWKEESEYERCRNEENHGNSGRLVCKIITCNLCSRYDTISQEI